MLWRFFLKHLRTPNKRSRTVYWALLTVLKTAKDPHRTTLKNAQQTVKNAAPFLRRSSPLTKTLKNSRECLRMPNWALSTVHSVHVCVQGGSNFNNAHRGIDSAFVDPNKKRLGYLNMQPFFSE